jgi:(1->4)-alpha-D-glucan 1-alpha-D-glucosylmutase
VARENVRATYRLQLTPDFGFREARELVPYLRELGVSHLYLSPSLQARRDSTHGYDVVDPTRISETLGGEDAFRDLCDAGLDVLLDIVPNHMAASEEENPSWRDPELRRKVFDVDTRTGWHRRFFDIGELAGVRVEDPEVFELTHAEVLELVRDGVVDGLRIDHIDGLARPGEYLQRLRDRGAERVWVEKILEPGESLPPWPVEGTTGYEFANDVTALFVDPAGEEALTELYGELTGERRPFGEVAREAKREQASTTFRAEAERLAALGGIPVEQVVDALVALPVYRTYLEEGVGIELARSLPDDVARLLLAGGEFTVRFQQTSGAVMAKGVEDTAFYRWFRLVALNEVGGNPGRFSLPVEEFHRGNLERAARFPLHLLASQTHDTKRSGDVRARIAALASIPDVWREHVLRWRELTGGLEDPNEEYLLWQTLVGAWPIGRERLLPYMEKALRESKRNTNWVEPNLRHERDVREFCTDLYDNRDFLDDFEPFVSRLARRGEHASLGALLLRFTAPGVPDLYQGDELWSLNLVDPDNRRPVSWERRRRALAQPGPRRDTMKLHLIRRLLALREERPDDFEAEYEALDAGPDVCAFRRGGLTVAVTLRPEAEWPVDLRGPSLVPEYAGLFLAVQR